MSFCEIKRNTIFLASEEMEEKNSTEVKSIKPAEKIQSSLFPGGTLEQRPYVDPIEDSLPSTSCKKTKRSGKTMSIVPKGVQRKKTPNHKLVIKATTIQHQIKRKQNNLLDDNLVEVKTEKLRGNFSAQNNNIREAVNKSASHYHNLRDYRGRFRTANSNDAGKPTTAEKPPRSIFWRGNVLVNARKRIVPLVIIINKKKQVIYVSNAKNKPRKLLKHDANKLEVIESLYGGCKDIKAEKSKEKQLCNTPSVMKNKNKTQNRKYVEEKNDTLKIIRKIINNIETRLDKTYKIPKIKRLPSPRKVSGPLIEIESKLTSSSVTDEIEKVTRDRARSRSQNQRSHTKRIENRSLSYECPDERERRFKRYRSSVKNLSPSKSKSRDRSPSVRRNRKKQKTDIFHGQNNIEKKERGRARNRSRGQGSHTRRSENRNLRYKGSDQREKRFESRRESPSPVRHLNRSSSISKNRNRNPNRRSQSHQKPDIFDGKIIRDRNNLLGWD